MTSQSNSPASGNPSSFSSFAGMFSMGVGLSALVGWLFHVELLKSWLPGHPSARFNAAACLVLLGFALCELRKRSDGAAHGPSHLAARIAAAIVVLVGLLNLLENLFGWNLGVDQLLYVVGPGEEIGGVQPGLIPPIAALDFVLLGCALLALDWKTRRGDWPAQFLAVAAGIGSLFGLLDFVLGLRVSHTHIALPSAVDLAVVSSGVICARAEWAWGGLLASRGQGAMLLRRVAPAALLAVNFVSWLESKALLTSAHLEWGEVSLIVVIVNVLLMGLILWTALIVERAEQSQARAEQALQIGREKLDQLMERYEDSPVEKALRHWAVGGIALAVLLTGFMGFLSWRSSEKAAEDADWVGHTHAVEAALAMTLKDAVDVETGARGFAVTGEASFLQPYQEGQTAIGQDLDRLRRLTADNSAQQPRLHLLQQQINAQIEISRRAIAERQESGAVPAKSPFVEGKRRMDEVRATVVEMQAEEATLLEQRTSRMQEARRSSKTLTAAGALMGMALLLFAGFGIRREINHSTRVRGQLKALNADLETRVELRTAALQAEVAERKRAEDVLREQAALLNLAHDAIFVRDLQSRVLFWNPGAEDTYGWSDREAKGRVTHELLQTRFPIPLEAIEAVLQEEGEWSGELKHLTQTGKEIVVASRWSLQRDEAGKPTAILEINRDITDRKGAEERLTAQAEELSRNAQELARSEREVRRLNENLEQRVQQRTAELQAANKELETFTYSVSHDLRAPLRHISGFAKMLAEECGPGIQTEAQHYLQRIQEGTRRMGLLVDDLLNLARIGRQELRQQVTGLESIARDVIADLAAEAAGRMVEWRIGSLPYVEGDPALLKQVFQNLLSNALKYSRPRAKAVIEIGQLQDQESPVIFVRDNGVGFSMKYADKLFGVFQRLHRAEDFEGTGVGLATVQRIIQKHGGRIWAEAELDKGATFYLTLGASEKTEAKTKAAMAGDKA